MSSAPPTRTCLACAQELEDEEGLISSTPNLWQPLGVVKIHRRAATVIWVLLLSGFVAYVFYMAIDLAGARKNPSASIKVKQERYSYPDLAFCVRATEGCYTYGPVCFDPSITQLNMVYQTGFIDNNLERDERTYEIEAFYPSCRVLPLSKLRVEDTAVENGDVVYHSVRINMMWLEDPNNSSDFEANSQFVQMYFIDVDSDVESMINLDVVDGKIPYDVIRAVTGETFTTVHSHVLLSLTEYIPIDGSGNERRRERTYTQRTTTGTLVWNWAEQTFYDVETAFLVMDISIPKFEYTVIVEVDPVDAWAIIGAIGGVWQIACMGFGLFFVFSVKQAPDKKLRNFKKTIMKPVVIVGRYSCPGGSRDDQGLQRSASESGDISSLSPSNVKSDGGNAASGSPRSESTARVNGDGSNRSVKTASQRGDATRPVTSADRQPASTPHGQVATTDTPVAHRHPRGGSESNPRQRVAARLSPPPLSDRYSTPASQSFTLDRSSGSRVGDSGNSSLPTAGGARKSRRTHPKKQPASMGEGIGAIPAPSYGSRGPALGSGADERPQSSETSA